MRNSRTTGPPKAPSTTDGGWAEINSTNAVEYDEDTDCYRTSFDSSEDPLSMAIVSTVSAVAETHSKELPPLYDAIDPEPLEELVDRRGTKPSKSDIHITFNFGGHDVTVHSYGIITVDPSQDTNST